MTNCEVSGQFGCRVVCSVLLMDPENMVEILFYSCFFVAKTDGVKDPVTSRSVFFCLFSQS